MKLEENVFDEFNNVINSIPDGLTPLEKVRWVYIKLGEIFCYDYYLDYQSKVDFSSNYINRYQTCVQISEILNYALNKIGDGVKSEVYERRLTRRGIYEQNHMANLVTLPSGEKYILDLTLDLFTIQGGFQTDEFGFSSNSDASVDMIPRKDCAELDQKLGLIKNGEYTDSRLKRLSFEIENARYGFERSFEEDINYIMLQLNRIMPKYRGFQEAKNCVNRCFSHTLMCNIFEYNLRCDEGITSCFCFRNIKQEEAWYLFNEKTGLVKTSSEEVFGMLNDGWYTKSNTLYDELYDRVNKIKR